MKSFIKSYFSVKTDLLKDSPDYDKVKQTYSLSGDDSMVLKTYKEDLEQFRINFIQSNDDNDIEIHYSQLLGFAADTSAQQNEVVIAGIVVLKKRDRLFSKECFLY